MSVLYLSEEEVGWLLDMDAAIDSLELAFRDWTRGLAENQPRRRVSSLNTTLHVLSGGSEGLGYLACKAYVTTRRGAQFLVWLYDATAGELVAVMEANLLGQIRTGAATGLATKLMARTDATCVGCFGSGFQARSQLKAVCRVRQIEQVTVYSRNPDRSRAFADEMTEYCGVTVRPAHSPEEAAREQDIIITATTSRTPVFEGRMIDEGTHLNVMGSNHASRVEIDAATIARADHVVCDDIEACQLESGELIAAVENGQFEWARARQLRDVLCGEETGRATAADITLFKSVGLGLQDAAVAAHVYGRAMAEGVGQPLPF